MEGEEKTVSWNSANGVRKGVIVAKFYRKKDNALLGYIIKMENGMRVIVHPKSFINPNHNQ